MEESKQYFWHIMLYFKKDKNATEMPKKTCAVDGEGAVTDQLCLKWSVKFHAGEFSLGDAPQSVRPDEVGSDQIETLIENNQCYTMWEIADILKIPKSIRLLVKMATVSFILQKKLNGLFGQPNTIYGEEDRRPRS